MPYEPMTLTTADAGQLLTLQRAAYVTEAQAHRDLELPPLTETLDELITQLVQPAVTALASATTPDASSLPSASPA
ncbi:hypothetical protein [Rhodococcus sp. PD04]|uniref:hypothetical protein n=1 Tax=Rhodococcus sp. PD04 TaxID=3109594 RepID=UPI002DD852F4|nr:hypothetical protein [Rhodococcus sp. PD04]WSE25906.1 hypothetical protein U9J23_27445 [Rhodococcus sp. PD04]